MIEFKIRQVLKVGALVFFWSIYPAVFTLGHNWFIITREQIIFILFLIPAASFGIYIVLSYFFIVFKWSCRRFGVMASDVWDPVVAGGVCVIIINIYVFLHATLLSVFKEESYIFLSLILFAIFFYIILTKTGTFLMFCLSSGLLLMAGAEWAYHLVAKQESIERASTFAKSTRLSVNGGGFVFIDKPNIYLIVYDGYGNKEALRIIYHIENTEISDFLREKDFIVNDNSFSNYKITWPMLLGLYFGEHHYYEFEAGEDDTFVGRSILNGTALNPVYSILTDNGYKIQTINRGIYFGNERGRIDFLFPTLSLWDGFDIFDNSFLKFLQVGLGSYARRTRRQFAMLDRRVAAAAKDQSPWFTFAYVYSPVHAKLEENYTELVGFEDLYRRKLKRADQHMRHIVKRIQSKDPNAFILLMGDHGGWRFNRSWHNDSTDDPNQAFEINRVPVRTASLDVFGILMAIETNGRCDDYVYETLSPVNVMRVIFACLSGKDLPADRPRDDSYFGDHFGHENLNFLTVESGVVLDRWYPLTAPLKIHGTAALPRNESSETN